MQVRQVPLIALTIPDQEFLYQIPFDHLYSMGVGIEPRTERACLIFRLRDFRPAELEAWREPDGRYRVPGGEWAPDWMEAQAVAA